MTNIFSIQKFRFSRAFRVFCLKFLQNRHFESVKQKGVLLEANSITR